MFKNIWNGSVTRIDSTRSGAAKKKTAIPIKYSSVVGAFSVGERNEQGGGIINHRLPNGLPIMNTFYKHRIINGRSYYGWNNFAQQHVSEKIVDLFLTSDQQIFGNVRAGPSWSTHRMVMATLTCKIEKPPEKKGETYLI